MAAASLIISKRRPCYVRDQKAMFHCWCQETYTVEHVNLMDKPYDLPFFQTMGLVELEDGSIKIVNVGDIRFADGGGFDEFAYMPNMSDKEEEA